MSLDKELKIAVIGAGISGLASAYLLSKKHQVDLYERDSRLGGHARTTQIEENNKKFGIDTGFLVFNKRTYPLLTKLFKELDVEVENSNMSFSFWDEVADIVYNGESLKGMFFQKKNLLNLNHYKMIADILKFNKKANEDLKNGSKDLELNLEEYIRPYSKEFKQRYIIPMGASIWSTPTDKMSNFPSKTFLQFFKNHGLLGVNTHHQWLTVSGGSINYVNKISKKISGNIFTNCDIKSINRENDGVLVRCSNSSNLHYDKIVFAIHAPDILPILKDATHDEISILSSFKYRENRAILHSDTKALYPKKAVYAAWNYKTNKDKNNIMLSYWINKLQNLHTKKEYFVSLNEAEQLQETIEEISYSHPQFDKKAILAQEKRVLINGKINTYYAGAYWRYGFHEDGLYSANTIAKEFGCEI